MAAEILEAVRTEAGSAAAAPRPIEDDPGLRFWWAGAHEHILEKAAPYFFLMKKRASAPLVVEAARGEVEPFQLIVTPEPGRSFQDVRLEFSALEGRPGGRDIPADAIDYQLVRYLNQHWPDILLPVPDGVETDPRNPYNYSFWTRISVPRDAVPGTYFGTVTVVSGGKALARKNYRLHVWDFQLPEETHLQSALFGVWRNFLSAQFPGAGAEKLKAMTEQICASLAAHRLGHGNDGMGPVPFRRDVAYWLTPEGQQEMLAWMEYWDGRGLNVGTVRVMSGRPSDEEKLLARRFWEKYYPVFKEKGWMGSMWHQHPDEYHTLEDARQYRKEAEFFREVAPDLRIMSTAIGAGLDVYREAVGGTDIWATELAVYTSPGLLEFFRERLAAGDEVFWYIHHHAAHPMDPLALRSLFWTAHREGITGICYWGVTVWGQQPIRKTRSGVCQDHAYGGLPLGDGVLFWPGEDRPLESVRLEYLREGIEDYEYLWLLQRNVRELDASGRLTGELRDRLARLGEQGLRVGKLQRWTDVHDGSHFWAGGYALLEHATDPGVFHEARRALGQAVEATTRILAGP